MHFSQKLLLFSQNKSILQNPFRDERMCELYKTIPKLCNSFQNNVLKLCCQMHHSLETTLSKEL
jgi:hypothetical protein